MKWLTLTIKMHSCIESSFRATVELPDLSGASREDGWAGLPGRHDVADAAFSLGQEKADFF
jgi:hypothetical protein